MQFIFPWYVLRFEDFNCLCLLLWWWDLGVTGHRLRFTVLLGVFGHRYLIEKKRKLENFWNIYGRVFKAYLAVRISCPCQSICEGSFTTQKKLGYVARAKGISKVLVGSETLSLNNRVTLCLCLRITSHSTRFVKQQRIDIWRMNSENDVPNFWKRSCTSNFVSTYIHLYYNIAYPPAVIKI